MSAMSERFVSGNSGLGVALHHLFVRESETPGRRLQAIRALSHMEENDLAQSWPGRVRLQEQLKRRYFCDAAQD
jgi:hypothetical protein